MANRLIRSPQYISSTSSSSTVQSVKLTITISNTLRYTLIKNAAQNVPVLFEWGELARDYLDITWNGTDYSVLPAFVIVLDLTFYPQINAGGTAISTTQQTHNGFDGYGTFYEAASPSMSSSEFPAISNYSQLGSTNTGEKIYTMYAPKNIGIQIPSILNGTVKYNASGFNADEKIINGIIVNIIRVPCTKYTAQSSRYSDTPDDIGYRVSFINKFGAIQTEFFTLKAVQQISSTRETFNSNTISSTGTYSINNHNKQNFNIQGGQSITLNSFYLPEYYNNVFTEMLLSEKVWVRFRVPSTGDFTTVPINITTSEFEYKNSLNDRLIQFTFSFDMSFDYINNIR